MTPQSAGYMCRIDSRMYAELHTSILQVNFLAIVEFYGLDKSDLIFQEENDPKHTPQKASRHAGSKAIKQPIPLATIQMCAMIPLVLILA